LVGNSEGETILRKPQTRREINIIMNIKNMVWEDVDLILLAQGRNQLWALANTVMKHQVT
jgi:hypothetical protein